MKIHFIGIGGIGVSALAQYYLEKGHQVSGSDLAPSEITDFLAKKGVKILVGNNAAHIKKDLDLVIYSPAVKKDNPEIMQAKSYKLKAISYPEALGQLTKQYTTIAITGSHGKSTTTAMIALILVKAGSDPTVIVGTKLKEFGNSNFRMGQGKYLVIEACEYDDSFSHYFPSLIVVTNTDKEHLDYFKTFQNVIKAFKHFILKLPAGGFLVFNQDDKNLVKISKGKLSAKPYSLQQKEAGALKKILKIPGAHNISNALAALAVARILQIPDKTALASLAEYQGSWRRFDVKIAELRGNLYGTMRKITIVSDYGHHPTEILATLMSAREKWPSKKIWCIFQPHQYQRTYYLFKDFVEVFKKVPIDNIIITDIYDVAGREEAKINQKINSPMLAEKIAKKNVRYLPVDMAEAFVKGYINSTDVLVIMGAGDIYKLADKF